MPCFGFVSGCPRASGQAAQVALALRPPQWVSGSSSVKMEHDLGLGGHFCTGVEAVGGVCITPDNLRGPPAGPMRRVGSGVGARAVGDSRLCGCCLLLALTVGGVRCASQIHVPKGKGVGWGAGSRAPVKPAPPPSWAPPHFPDAGTLFSSRCLLVQSLVLESELADGTKDVRISGQGYG